MGLLDDAARILDDAAAYVEEYGFDAHHYGSRTGEPRCFIGACRCAAALPSFSYGDPAGGVPALAVALSSLDLAASEFLPVDELNFCRQYTLFMAKSLGQLGRIAEKAGMRHFVDHRVIFSRGREILAESSARASEREIAYV